MRQKGEKDAWFQTAYLSKTFLSSPDGRVDDLQEELTSAGIEDEDCTVDGLRRQIALKRLKEHKN